MSKTILIADDDKLIREGLVALLKNEGQTVIEAANGKQSLEMALSERPDLVVTDINMPELTGLQMIESLREDEWGKTVPVIILSNDESNASINQALQSGVTTYFPKGTDPLTLTQQILQAVSE